MTSTAPSVSSPSLRRPYDVLAAAARRALAVPRVYVALAAAFIAARIVTVAGAAPDWSTDSWGYVHQAHMSVFTKRFWVEARGFTTPLLYKLANGNDLRVAAQVAIGIGAWLWLAAAVARSVRDRRVAVAAFGLTLLFGSTLWVGMWDAHILSESLSVSLGAALIAAWLELLRRPSWPIVVTLLAIAALWANTRDSNAPLLLLVLPLPLIWLIRSAQRRRLAAACLAGLIVITIYSLEADQRARRWGDGLTHVVALRIVPDRPARAFFIRHGLPLSPQVRSDVRAGTWAALIEIPQLPGGEDFIHWIVYHGGEPTYRQWLLAHPGSVVSLVWRNLGGELAIDRRASAISPALGFYRPPGVRQVLPTPVQDAVDPPGAIWAYAYALLLIPLLVFALTRGFCRRQATVPLVLLLLTIPHAAVVIVNEPAEIARHALLVGLLVRLAFLLGLVFAADAWLSRRAGTGRAPGAAAA